MVNRSFAKLFQILTIMTLVFCTQAIAATGDSSLDEELNINMEADAESAASSVRTSDIPTEKANEVPKLDEGELHADANNLVLDERDYSPVPESAGQVSIEKGEDYSLPYRQRRSHHGVLFSVGMEKIEPLEYTALLHSAAAPTDETLIEGLIGSTTLDMVQIELGYKYNFKLGSVYLLGAYSMGKGSNVSGADSRELSLTKKNLSIGYSADAIFDEPWVVPYAQAGIHQFNVSEKLNDVEDSATTQPSLNYRVGLQFQLNWIEKSIDPNTQFEGLRSSGLENTYLDVFASWYEPSSDLYDPQNPVATKEGDPDLRSEGTMGLALKMEF